MSFRVLFLSMMFFISCVVCVSAQQEKGAGEATVSVLHVTSPEIKHITSPNIDAIRKPKMLWGDASRKFDAEGKGIAFSKDPSVVRFRDKYLMYFSLPPSDKEKTSYGWTIGIAESDDLIHWKRTGQILPMEKCDAKGLCAPCAVVIKDKVHLFYQTYGNGKDDAICTASSDDGLDFTPHASNPIFRPSGDYTCGRAIDADFFIFKGKAFLYAATRDPEMKIQKLVVATADPDSDFGPESWSEPVDASILEPELAWETRCIEAATVCERNGVLIMFYAGGYNNDPQQIGVARSEDGIHWTRLWSVPFIPNGESGSWNSSESGHPGVFVDGENTYLFYQGNSTKGRNWLLSRVKLGWTGEIPYVVEE